MRKDVGSSRQTGFFVHGAWRKRNVIEDVTSWHHSTRSSRFDLNLRFIQSLRFIVPVAVKVPSSATTEWAIRIESLHSFRKRAENCVSRTKASLSERTHSERTELHNRAFVVTTPKHLGGDAQSECIVSVDRERRKCPFRMETRTRVFELLSVVLRLFSLICKSKQQLTRMVKKCAKRLASNRLYSSTHNLFSSQLSIHGAIRLKYSIYKFKRNWWKFTIDSR